MINDDQDTVCQGHDGFLAAHVLFESLVGGAEAGVLAACGPDEGLLQPPIALAGLGTQPFASADLDFRTQPCPTDKGTYGTVKGFTGQYNDSVSGLDYYNAS